MNADEFSEMDPYEEVAQQGQEDPNKEHEPEDDDEDPEEDPNEEHEPEDEDTKEKKPSEGSDETEPFKEVETAIKPPPPRHSLPILTAPPLGCDVAESSVAAARAPREDVGYVRALQASEHRMMTSIEDVNLRVSYQTHVRRKESADFYTLLLDARTDRRDIRLMIDVRQSAKDLPVTQMMRIYALDASAQTDTVEDIGRHIKKNCPKLKNHGNGSGNSVAQRRAYALGGRDASPNSNVITDWLTMYHGVIICDEKIVRVPFKREMLIFQGNGDNQREESRLNIISCTKAQEYLSKGCDVFLAHIIRKEAKDKSEGKRLEDVPIVRDFPEVFPDDLPGKENVIVNALSKKEQSRPLRVQALVMTICLNLPKKILEAQTEALKPENLNAEDVGGMLRKDPQRKSWNPGFTSLFWQALHKALGTRLDMSTAYHPKMDGQRERTIQTLKDMLRACVIKAAPFEALYGRKCQSPVCWAEVRDAQLTGPKSYVDIRCKPMVFQVGDKVMLKVSPWKGVVRFGKQGKLNLDINGMIKVLPPKTAEEVVARERERKDKTTSLMALPKDHLEKFHKMADAKEMWEAIKSRFGGNDESKKMQKYLLKQQFEGFSVSASQGITESSSSNTQNVTFMSADNTSNTNDVSTAYSVSSPFVSKSQKEGSASYTDEINNDDIEEMDLKWQVAMISMRIKKFHKRTSIKLQFDTKDTVGFDKTKMECFNCHKIGHFARDCRAKGNQDIRRGNGGHNGKKLKTMSGHVEEDTQNFVMMAYSSSNSGSDNENEVLQSVFMNKECDLENTPVNNRYAKGMHTVPPPMTGNYMPSGPDVEIDYSKFTYGPKQTSADESNSKPVEYASSDSDSSVETTTSMSTPVDNAPKIICKPKVWTDAPIIEEYESDNDDDSVETVKETGTPNHYLKIEKQDRHSHTRKDYQEFKGGFVAFRGSNGKITGKGKIKAGRLDFKDVYYVKELKHYNLFSMSQMCNKKKKALFTDTDCLVLSLDFKLLDENQVLLKIPRQHNMYSFNLKNIDPSGDLSCLFAKASIDESNK
nr:hypothetical protein [Tanacetum cinerariifolium]